MTISNVSISNQHLQQATVGAIKTDQKTVHKEDIKELKNEIKSVKHTIICVYDVSESLFNGKINHPLRRAEVMENAYHNVSKNAQAINRLNEKIAHLKENINSSSYKHHSSKIKTLKALTNQVSNMKLILGAAHDNFQQKARKKNVCFVSYFPIDTPSHKRDLPFRRA
ncbi:hypothetical protein [Providencia rettgeri]|uniref:hypothetical protein n=1 Tax=Providencia rettgeri TaxID=587 RepID=UPI001373CAA6|nr:hypothetical protein [Providencia rettgeri]BBU95016.1 hypothetical protein BML2496_08990 [Providencia rettgeri]